MEIYFLGIFDFQRKEVTNFFLDFLKAVRTLNQKFGLRKMVQLCKTTRVRFCKRRYNKNSMKISIFHRKLFHFGFSVFLCIWKFSDFMINWVRYWNRPFSLHCGLQKNKTFLSLLSRPQIKIDWSVNTHSLMTCKCLNLEGKS